MIEVTGPAAVSSGDNCRKQWLPTLCGTGFIVTGAGRSGRG
jgi:hypothetical protein